MFRQDLSNFAEEAIFLIGAFLARNAILLAAISILAWSVWRGLNKIGAFLIEEGFSHDPPPCS